MKKIGRQSIPITKETYYRLQFIAISCATKKRGDARNIASITPLKGLPARTTEITAGTAARTSLLTRLSLLDMNGPSVEFTTLQL